MFSRISVLGVAIALVAALHVAPVGATPPLDPSGEDTGFIPPGKSQLKCERYMNKRVTLVSVCTLQCHIKAAQAIFRNLPFDNDSCEETAVKSCKAKYDKSLTLLSPGLCPTCMDATAQEALFPNYHDYAENFSASIFCDNSNSVSFGAGHQGSGSKQVDISKCEIAFARNAQKLVKCVQLRCHRALADDLFAGAPNFNETACEEDDPIQSCKARFNFANSKLVGCPPCLDAPSQAALFDVVEPTYDNALGSVYCAQ